MAKEFKNWDKVFSKDQIQSMRNIWLDEESCSFGTDKWFTNALEHMGYESHYTVGEVRDAVYNASDANEWQCFRVAMKGLSTREKVFMLHRRWNDMHTLLGVGGIHANEDDWQIEKLRIHNYIGALKRGGQLIEDEFGRLVINK